MAFCVDYDLIGPGDPVTGREWDVFCAKKVQFMHIEEANSLQRAAGYISGFLGFAVESGSCNAAAFFPSMRHLQFEAAYLTPGLGP
jgi:hypothetical protein